MFIVVFLFQGGCNKIVALKQMNRRKGKIAELIENKAECIKSLFDDILYYLNLLDLDTGTNHCKVFTAVYLDGDKTYEQVSEECHLDVRTITRYVRKYDLLAEKLIKENNLLNEDIK